MKTQTSHSGIMRITYQFRISGRTYHGINIPIGDTANPNWFREDGGKGKRYHKWSAIFAELPDLYNALNDISETINEQNPGDYGFRFEYIEEGD